MRLKIGNNIRYYSETIKKGMANPGAAVGFANRVITNIPYSLKYEYYRRKNGIPLQYDYVHDFVDQDEFLIIILDSCRYDYFKEEFSTFLSGELTKIWSAANRTPKWVPYLWDKSYNLTYISRMSWPTTTSAYNDRRISFNPYETFDQVIRVNQDPDHIIHKDPASTTDVAIQHFKQASKIRTVVHYSPPHRPYIGETKILPYRIPTQEVIDVLGDSIDEELENELINGRDSLFAEELIPLGVTREEFGQMEKEAYNVRERLADGYLSDQELQQAYRENLREVLGEVKRLISYLDCPIVISADHGEHLGEHKNEIPRYNHPNRTHPVLREVPWFIVGDDSKNQESLSEVPDSPELLPGVNVEPSMEEVKRHLEYMGYR